jgi:hypothetical protein
VAASITFVSGVAADQTFENHSRGLVVDEGIVYYAATLNPTQTSSRARLVVCDFTVPASPSRIAALALATTTSQSWDVAKLGDYVYVVGGGLGLKTVGVSTPSAPSIVHEQALVTGAQGFNGNAVVVSGTTLFVHGQSGSLGHLSKFDLSDPAAPSLIDSVSRSPDLRLQGGLTSGFHPTRHLAVAGDYLYVCASNVPQLTIVRQSDLLTHGQLSINRAWTVVKPAGDYAYVFARPSGSLPMPTSGNSRLVVVNVSDPSSPTFVANIFPSFSGFGNMRPRAESIEHVAPGGILTSGTQNVGGSFGMHAFETQTDPAAPIAIANNSTSPNEVWCDTLPDLYVTSANGDVVLYSAQLELAEDSSFGWFLSAGWQLL